LVRVDIEDARIERDLQFAKSAVSSLYARCDSDRRVMSNRPFELG
jgi:hypothetical protein